MKQTTYSIRLPPVITKKLQQLEILDEEKKIVKTGLFSKFVHEAIFQFIQKSSDNPELDLLKLEHGALEEELIGYTYLIRSKQELIRKKIKALEEHQEQI